jgi:hypothetical protein
LRWRSPDGAWRVVEASTGVHRRRLAAVPDHPTGAEPRVETDVRLSELIAVISFSSDFGLGQPMEHVLRSTLIALRIAERLGVNDDVRRETYWVTLLARSVLVDRGEQQRDVPRRSVVVRADPGVAFGFDTESTLDRKHGKTWHARFADKYSIEATAGGSIVRYVAEVRPQSYVPYWLKPWMRPMTPVMVQSMMRSNLLNLVVMAETPVEQDR